MKTKIFYVIAITNSGPELHEFYSEKAKLEWLATQDRAEDDFVAFEVEGTISGLENPHVGEDAKEVLEEMLAEEAERMKPRIVETAGLQWLVLPDEGEESYTNVGDGRESDATALVSKVNSDQALGLGHCDWRLPTKNELKKLIGTTHAPKGRRFWSACPCVGGSNTAWTVYFGTGSLGGMFRDAYNHVRLVRSTK